MPRSPAIMSSKPNSKGRRGRRRTKLLTLRNRKPPGGGYNIKELEAAEAEFLALPMVWNSFVVNLPEEDPESPDGYRWKKTRFQRGDDVLLNSNFDDGPDMWVGRIVQIRTNTEKTEMLVQVRWYFSRNDTAELHIRSFDRSTRSPYERIVSDYHDFLSPRTLQAVTHVQEYDETVLDPPQFGPTDLFVRSTLHFWRRKVSNGPSPIEGNAMHTARGESAAPISPFGEDTCRCHEPYNPYPELRTSSSSVFRSTLSLSLSLSVGPNSIMHFCPRLGCRKWYHNSCLVTMGHTDTVSPPSTRGLRLLAVDPYSEVPFATFAYFSEQESAEDMALASDKLDISDALEMFGRSPLILAHLPPSLLSIAQSPIARCSGAPHGWAIGNVADVALARRFVYTAIEHSGRPEAPAPTTSNTTTTNTTTAGGFPQLLQLADDLEAFAWLDTEDGVAQLEALCAGLEGFDLLASVYTPYWERRWEGFVEMQALLGGPAFVCPECGSAI
ncbi:hypothetical protein L226DRAFT_541065 [Lentinus tigrinus ALCF2SS1-7]|uniref:BAH domain-containing protein n=1 Tax=Lentinus tigrinus ALCF2SS1-6 TaxID=1328759 RepID=A0A5C2SA37_9APHY|nr:hypothetical protein L227DRAFT_600843 [Lentinus tigrinus ALCF2SS1-6]RPD68068.1 hypothetical protein L226DRAFT_541065 [Lentinus tigrinus ALCF2SS1-7]